MVLLVLVLVQNLSFFSQDLSDLKHPATAEKRVVLNGHIVALLSSGTLVFAYFTYFDLKLTPMICLISRGINTHSQLL